MEEVLEILSLVVTQGTILHRLISLPTYVVNHAKCDAVQAVRAMI